jgi:glycosyltransferase involved in cell wall biosynthesis|tara:strand:+ start:213 stop:1016 length:804 start_codon:yes stop_codon:yes gene_type:complete
MNKDPLVSIIITNFNKSKYMLQSVKSCLNQSYKKKEIIFFDDKSTDNSLKKIKDFKNKNKLKFRIISNPSKKENSAPINQMIAVKKSLNFAKGKYVFLLDSDDFFHKNKIFEIITIFKKDKQNKMILDLPIYKYKKKEVKKNFINKNLKNKWPKFPSTSCMCFEKKSLKNIISKIEFKKYPNLAIDFFLAVYHSVILKNFYIHKSHLTYYRQLGDGTESNYIKFKSKKWWIRRKEAFEFLNSLLVKNKLPLNRSLDYFITKFLNQFL